MKLVQQHAAFIENPAASVKAHLELMMKNKLLKKGLAR
jgi:hypothetical protein